MNNIILIIQYLIQEKFLHLFSYETDKKFSLQYIKSSELKPTSLIEHMSKSH